MRFRKISRTAIDDTRVTLILFATEAGSLHGRVSTLAIAETGNVELMDVEPLPVTDALALACRIAAFKGQDLDVFDPDGLWTAELGELI